MKNLLLTLFLITSALFSVAQNQSKETITPFRNKTITTHSSGLNPYTAWSKFPSASKEVRRIFMHVTLGCPDTLPCAHWDYLDHITLKKQGGKNGKQLDYEIGRLLTPYGSIYNKGWNYTWSVDVTDFSQVLRDSVELEYAHSGFETPTVGWSLTIDFEFQYGKPVARPISISPMWKKGYSYGDSTSKFEDEVHPLQFETPSSASFSRFRIQQTGHGMDRPNGCSEFCSRWREVLYNGRVVDHRVLWKDCGSNPLYPQGGTWIFDRGWWCPGDLQQPDIVDLPARTGSNQIALQMQPYVATANVQGREDIASYLIQYTRPTSAHDVSIEEIIVPNSSKKYNRLNPAVHKPTIIIKNLGGEPLRQLTIEYKTKGFPVKQFVWKGYLQFNQTENIVLPGTIDFKDQNNEFEVFLKNPNGKKDEWQGDNRLVSQFNSPIKMPEKLVVQFLTNNNPSDNSLLINNTKGESIFKKLPDQLKPATLYNDTIVLPQGGYELQLSDSAGNGLEFWYERKQGFGYLRLLDTKGKMLFNFESDCGNGQHLSFVTTPDFKEDTLQNNTAFILYPRFIKDTISLYYHMDKTSKMDVIITADGVVKEKHSYQDVKSGQMTYTISRFTPGRYIIEALVNGESKFKRRFNKE